MPRICPAPNLSVKTIGQIPGARRYFLKERSLKGWRKVSDQHPLTKPEFDAVTGVSTGTLIAPFAFLGGVENQRSTRTVGPQW